MELVDTHTSTSDYILRDTCKSTMSDSENSKAINKMLTEKGSTFKEYNVDEFLQKLMLTIHLLENGKYCTKCKKNKNIEEFARNQNWCKACKNTLFKEYYNRNQEKMKENLKKDYEKRKNLMICTCGKVINSVSYKAHLKTKSHYNLLNEK